MAWIKVGEQSHLSQSEAGADESTAVRVFVCVSDSPTDSVAAETADDGTTAIPETAAVHPADPTRRVKSVQVQADEEAPRTVFTVRVNYSSKVEEQKKEEDPTDRPDEITWDFEDKAQPYFKDETTPTPKNVVNSAGEPFEEFLERDAGSLTATVRRNVAPGYYDPATAIAYKDVVNQGGFRLDGKQIADGQAKLKAYTAGATKTENGFTYREVQWVLQFRESWDDKIEDRGFNEKDPDNPGHVKAIVTNIPPTKPDKPWPLDGSGAAKLFSDDAPEVLTFKPYKKKSFAKFKFS